MKVTITIEDSGDAGDCNLALDVGEEANLDNATPALRLALHLLAVAARTAKVKSARLDGEANEDLRAALSGEDGK